MLILNTKEEIKNNIGPLKEGGKSVGFVPTMGALHEGHISLLKRAKEENEIVVCSIYVNPLQFNNKEDFAQYPRLPEKDTILLENAGCDIVFIPDDSIINKSPDFNYDLGYLDEIMEGYFRPDHFKGVAYIVKTFLEIVGPDRAYFGEKDYQQLTVVKKMTRDFNLPVEIVSCPTSREKDGLALSSRNARLTVPERQIAPKIYEGLIFIKNNIHNYNFDELKLKFVNHIEHEQQMKVEYVEICDSESLKILSALSESKCMVVCTAVFLGNVRLIDNVKIFS